MNDKEWAKKFQAVYFLTNKTGRKISDVKNDLKHLPISWRCRPTRLGSDWIMHIGINRYDDVDYVNNEVNKLRMRLVPSRLIDPNANRVISMPPSRSSSSPLSAETKSADHMMTN